MSQRSLVLLPATEQVKNQTLLIFRIGRKHGYAAARTILVSVL